MISMLLGLILTIFFVEGYANMDIRLNKDYYVQMQLLEVNCSSSVPINAVAIEIDGFQNASIMTNDTTCINVNNASNPTACSWECKCNPDKKSFVWIFNITNRETDMTISCSTLQHGKATKTISSALPVKSVSISPNGVDNYVSIEVTKTEGFTCTTDFSRPVAWIQWYIGSQNFTDISNLTTTPNGTKWQSISTLQYEGKDDDHNTTIICNAGTIEDYPIVSDFKTLLIEVPVSRLNITPIGSNNVINVISNENITFTCTTDLVRPAARVYWYIGEQNITEQAFLERKSNGTKFISTSLITYKANDENHNETVFCEASNIAGKKITSKVKTLNIKVPVTQLDIKPSGMNNVVSVVLNEIQTFTCTTNPARPPARIQWYIEGERISNQVVNETTIIDGNKFISISLMVYKAVENNHNEAIYCEATNIEGETIQTVEKTLYIKVPVTAVSLTPVGRKDKVIVINRESKIFNCTTDSSRPAPKIDWFIGGGKITENVSYSVTQDDTKFIASSRMVYTGNDNDHGEQVYCEASDTELELQIKSNNLTLFVIVPVNSASIWPTFNNKSLSVNAGEEYNFTCTTDLSRPAVEIQWFIGKQNVSDQAITISKENGTKYFSSSRLRYTGEICDHNQSITCEALNLYGRTTSREEYLYVFSKPTYDKEHDLQSEIFIGTNDGLNLTVYLLANPKPVIEWMFQGDIVPIVNATIQDFNTSNFGIFRHVTSYQKKQVAITDYGSYTIKASNGIGSGFVHVISVKPARAPYPPIDVHAVCDQNTPSINVSWVSNLNGGATQTFFVLSRNTITDILRNSSATIDEGHGKIHSQNNIFDYDSHYELYVEARNKHGSVNSFEVVNCTTSKKIPLSSGSSSAFVGVAVGCSAAFVVVAVIGLVVFVRRRNSKKGDDKQHLQHRSKRQNAAIDENDEDALNDNPLYGTSRMHKGIQEYEQVEQINRKPKNGKWTENIELGTCEYENSNYSRRQQASAIYGNINGQLSGASPSPSRKINTNKDRLIYADLVFASSGTKFIIRGSDNRTNYANIDLSKTAEPLPTESDEDDINETYKGSTADH